MNARCFPLDQNISQDIEMCDSPIDAAEPRDSDYELEDTRALKKRCMNNRKAVTTCLQYSRRLPAICKLPQELHDMILDFLRADKQSLRACTLTLHQWIYPARRHLFHTFHICISPSAAEEMLLSFVAFLQTAPLSITNQVKELYLCGSHHITTVFSEVKLRDLAAGIACLPELSLLSLSGLLFKKNPDGTLCGGLPSVPLRFKELQLNYMDLTKDRLQEVLLLCTNTSHLSVPTSYPDFRGRFRGNLAKTHFPPEARVPSSIRSMCITLDALTRSDDYSGAIAELMRTTSALSLLEQLECQGLYQNASGLPEILAECGSQLQEIFLNMDQSFDEFDTAAFGLYQCTSLKRLKIAFGPEICAEPRVTARIIAQVLAEIFKGERSLTLDLYLAVPDEWLHAVDGWDEVIGPYCTQGRIHTVTMCCTKPFDYSYEEEPPHFKEQWALPLSLEGREKACDRMPKLWRLGVLQF